MFAFVNNGVELMLLLRIDLPGIMLLGQVIVKGDYFPTTWCSIR